MRRTRIGSPFAIEAMNALLADIGSVCGYEANGGVLLATPVAAESLGTEGRTLSALPTRNAVLPMLAVLAATRRQGVTLSKLQAQLPRALHFQRTAAELSHRPEPSAAGAASGRHPGRRAGTRLGSVRRSGWHRRLLRHHRRTAHRLRRGDIIHLRPGGNAPELRCFLESATPERAAWLTRAVLEMILES